MPVHTECTTKNNFVCQPANKYLLPHLSHERAPLQLLQIPLILLVAAAGAVGGVHGNGQPGNNCFFFRKKMFFWDCVCGKLTLTRFAGCRWRSRGIRRPQRQCTRINFFCKKKSGKLRKFDFCSYLVVLQLCLPRPPQADSVCRIALRLRKELKRRYFSVEKHFVFEQNAIWYKILFFHVFLFWITCGHPSLSMKSFPR